MARLRKHGRAAVGTLVLVWVASQFGLARAVEASLWLRDPMFADKRVKFRQRIAERTTAAGRPLAMAFIGSSRTCFAVRGDVVEDTIEPATGRRVAAVNFGIPASGPVTNLLMVRRLVTSADRPDVCVIELLPPLLANRGTAPAEHPFLNAERLRRDEVDVVRGFGFPDDVADRWRAADLMPWYGLRFPLLGRVAKTWLPWGVRFCCSRETDPTGWLKPMYETVTPDTYRTGVLRARLEYYDLLQILQFDTPAFHAVEQSLTVCRQNDVHVALLLMPEGTDFRSWYPPAVEAELYARLDDLSRRTGVPVIDARRWFDDGAFSDAHHMVPAGATEFSKRLARAIQLLVTTPHLPSRPQSDR
jgi:hypothetical protein